MDTKSKSNNKGIVVVLAVMAAVSLAVVACFPAISGAAGRRLDNQYESTQFVQDLYHNGFVLYWELMQEYYDEYLEPVDVFLPDLNRRVKRGEEGYTDYMAERLQETARWKLTEWRSAFHDEWNGLAYWVIKDGDDLWIGNGGDKLRLLVQDARELLWVWGDTGEYDYTYAVSEVQDSSASLEDAYSYYVVLHYGENGSISVVDLYGASAYSLDSLTRMDMWQHWDNLFGEQTLSNRQMELPKGMMVAYAVPRDTQWYEYMIMDQQYYQRRAFADSGFSMLYSGALLLAAVLGGGYAWYRRWQPGPAAEIPLEMAGVLVYFSLYFQQPLSWLGTGVGQNILLFLEPSLSFEGKAARPVGYIASFLLMFLAMLLVFVSTLSVTQIRKSGLLGYLRHRSLLVRGLAVLKIQLARLYRWVSDINFSETGNKAIVRILFANFIILSLICCLWFFGIFALVIYTFVLFLILRRRLRDIQQKYAELLRVTGEMAKGRLDTPFSQELGIFDSLGRELQEVQTGFRQAVEAEVRSQNMRTELITNVSHDLKTPLTAIITYVNLLKDEAVSPEERRSYIETLDSKSQRLKALIEDLFEVSKANSGNMPLNPCEVELVSLLRQVELEIKAEIETAQIDLRHRYPQERALVYLDGERTSRIFENLLINVTKYAMYGTRAYIDVTLKEEWVRVEIKNISREPLDFDTGDLTERFVRGDRSRNTQGSGLGLAIAKSFTELQGGNFSVVTDGDLFKSVVEFRRMNPKGQSTDDNDEKEPEDEVQS